MTRYAARATLSLLPEICDVLGFAFLFYILFILQKMLERNKVERASVFMTYPQLQPSPYILRLKEKDKKDRCAENSIKLLYSMNY